MRRFSSHALNQRTVQVETKLEDFGDLIVTDQGSNGAYRRVRFDLTAPGYDLEPIAYLKYEDTFLRDGSDWLLLKYRYDYIDRTRDMRLAYHMHDVGSASGVYHLHCCPADDPSPKHYRAFEWSLFEAHDEFMRLLAGDEPIDCTGARPLEPTD